MTRRDGELFEDYKKRRAGEANAIKLHLRGEKIKYTYKELKKLWEANNG